MLRYRMSIFVKEINTDEEFQAFIADGKVCIDFWAPWCGPCIRFAPTFEQFASANTNIKFGKVNVDLLPNISTFYKVKSIPTIILFENGTVKNTQIGTPDEDSFSTFLAR